MSDSCKGKKKILLSFLRQHILKCVAETVTLYERKKNNDFYDLGPFDYTYTTEVELKTTVENLQNEEFEKMISGEYFDVLMKNEWLEIPLNAKVKDILIKSGVITFKFILSIKESE